MTFQPNNHSIDERDCRKLKPIACRSVARPERAGHRRDADGRRARGRARRQIWDEVKHGQLHADVLLRGGFVKREEELMDDPRANTQPKLSYFGMTAMFPHIHPLARAGQHYYNESMACLGIAAT